MSSVSVLANTLISECKQSVKERNLSSLMGASLLCHLCQGDRRSLLKSACSGRAGGVRLGKRWASSGWSGRLTGWQVRSRQTSAQNQGSLPQTDTPPSFHPQTDTPLSFHPASSVMLLPFTNRKRSFPLRKRLGSIPLLPSSFESLFLGSTVCTACS